MRRVGCQKPRRGCLLFGDIFRTFFYGHAVAWRHLGYSRRHGCGSKIAPSGHRATQFNSVYLVYPARHRIHRGWFFQDSKIEPAISGIACPSDGLQFDQYHFAPRKVRRLCIHSPDKIANEARPLYHAVFVDLGTARPLRLNLGYSDLFAHSPSFVYCGSHLGWAVLQAKRNVQLLNDCTLDCHGALAVETSECGKEAFRIGDNLVSLYVANIMQVPVDKILYVRTDSVQPSVDGTNDL